MNQLKQFTEQAHASPKNRRRFMVLMGGLKWKPYGSPFKDMEFTLGKEMAREDTCAAYGVPPAVAGFYKDSNYAHADAAERGLLDRHGPPADGVDRRGVDASSAGSLRGRPLAGDAERPAGAARTRGSSRLGVLQRQAQGGADRPTLRTPVSFEPAIAPADGGGCQIAATASWVAWCRR